MRHKPLLLALFTIGLAAGGLAAGRNISRAARPAQAASDVLFRVGDQAVRAADVQAHVDRLPEMVRSRLASFPEDRQGFFDKLVDTEIFVQEARRMGYDRDPEVLQATRRAMVVKLLTARLGASPGDGIDDAAVEAFYRSHAAQFGGMSLAEARPRIVRALSDDARDAKLSRLAGSLRQEHPVSVYADNFRQVRFDAARAATR